MCFDFLYNFFCKTYLILRRIQRDAITNAVTSDIMVFM